MKKLFLTGTALITLVSGSAMAADLSRPRPAPVYTKAPPAPALFTWTGCYIGGNGGGVFVRKEVSEVGTGLSDGSVDFSGGLGGGQVGCNYQFSTWVVGIQGDWDWSGASGSFNNVLFPGEVDSAKVKSLASVTGRLGYAWDRFLLYAKGGGAWERDDYSATTGAFVSTASDTRTGWTAGGGGEYAFTDWLTGFVEYDFYDFGTNTENFSGTNGTFGLRVKETKSVAKAGLNIKFGAWH